MVNNALAAALLYGTKRPKVFVSYHHGAHSNHYQLFSELMHDRLELLTDCSLEERINSDDNDYVRRAIRERFIDGTSCTVVLCGATTYGRKFVDWEINDTLLRKHGLIGVAMPDIPSTLLTGCQWPERLEDNLKSGFAAFTTWRNLLADPGAFRHLVLAAANRPRYLIANTRELRQRDRNPDNALANFLFAPPR